ncbi:MAG: YybS family protein [Desulfobacteraceae bacterium]|nr:YybS family protein [Desulfobacteraceae bacterium]
MTNNYTIIRDISIGIALCLLIFISTLSLPLFGFFIALLLPQPVLFFRLKLGKAKGAIIPIAAFLIILIVMHSLLADVFFYGSLLLTGFLIGNYLEKQLSIEKTILYTFLTTVGICLLLFVLYSFTNEKSFFMIVSDYVAKNIELSFKIYSEIGIDQKKINSLAKSSDLITHVIIRIMPSMFTTMLLFITWLNILLIKKILKRDGVVMSWLGILNHWKAPEHLVWFTILTLTSIFIPIESIKIIGLNIFIVLLLIYFFQGIAIVSFFFNKKEFPSFLKFFLYTLIVIQQIFALLVIGLGFFDTWFDFRKLDLKQNLQN